MKELIDQLYYVSHNPLVTPACLISNVKLPEYQSLVFRKDGQGLVAIMECSLDGEPAEFQYFFDEQDHLSRAVCTNLVSNQEEVLFDRVQEVRAVQARIVRNRNCEQSAAIPD
jgi:hypothetical protein